MPFKPRPARKSQERLETPAEPGMTVTALKPVRDKPDQRRVYVDRRSVGSVDAAEVARLGLEVGSAWTEELRSTLVSSTDHRKARARAMWMLSRRPLTRAMLIDKLVKRGHSHAAAESAADLAARSGLINDAAYAASLAGSELRGSRSRFAVKRKLRQRGVDPETITLAVEGAAAEEGRTDLERATDFATARLRGSLARQPADTRRRRLYGMLARRGFDSDTCRAVISKLVRDDRDGPAAD